MSLFNEILSFTTALPDWQRDTVRCLFQQEELTQQGYDDLYAMLKAAHGIPDPQNRQPVPLAAGHLPAGAGEATVILKAMRDLRHVNRIASGQNLTFSSTGITVIYGRNASGKSGYSRVLKCACRARNQEENVLPDATSLGEKNSVPEATFDIAIGATAKSVKWVRGTASPDELSTIEVFDAHCARSYMREGEPAYLPYGMDIIENLANKVLPKLKEKLDQEILSVNVDASPFNHLCGETAVGKLIANLNAKTDPSAINALAILSEKELSRISELNTVLSEIDPKTKAAELQLSSRRIKEIATSVDSVLAWVKDEAVTRLKKIHDDAVAAEETERVAARVLQSGENLLPGTGEQVWKSLFEAARKFSTEVAYPGCPFPRIGKDAVCPLCQQSLTDGGERLNRFEKYIRDDAARVANEKRQQLKGVQKKIEDANITILSNSALRAELSQLENTLVSTVTTFEEAVEARRSWMLTAVNSHCWDNMPALTKNPRSELRNLAARQLKAARTFKKAADETKKRILKAEYDELIT